MISPTLRGRVLTLGMIVGSLVLGVFLALVILTLSERAPAMHVLAQSDAGQAAANDGRLLVYMKVNRVRWCKVEATHRLFTMIKHDSDDVPVYVPIVEDGAAPVNHLGVTSYVLSVPLPAGLWPSDWYWLESRIEYCGWLGWLFPIYSESAPLPINIERARAIPNVPVTAERDGKTIVRSRSPALPPVAPPGAKP